MLIENRVENLIRRTIEDFFKRMNFSFESLNLEKHENPEGQEILTVKIKSDDDCSLLLEEKSQNLKALEHIVRLLVLKETNQRVNLILDLNDFLEKRNSRISELARLVAEKVKATQKSFTLRPMSAYERRLVHLELANWPDIKTESVGEEPKRRIVVKPIERNL